MIIFILVTIRNDIWHAWIDDEPCYLQNLMLSRAPALFPMREFFYYDFYTLSFWAPLYGVNSAEESWVYCHFEALAEKSTLYHTYRFLTFVRNDTLTSKIIIQLSWTSIHSGWHIIHKLSFWAPLYGVNSAEESWVLTSPSTSCVPSPIRRGEGWGLFIQDDTKTDF